MMIKVILIIAVVTIINSPFQPCDFSTESTTAIAAFKASKFTSSLKNSSPYNRIEVTTDSLLFNIVLSILLILFRRVDPSG